MSVASMTVFRNFMYLWDLSSSDDLHHEFLWHRLKVLAHDDVVIVCFTYNETKTEVLEKTNTNMKLSLSPWRQWRYRQTRHKQPHSVKFSAIPIPHKRRKKILSACVLCNLRLFKLRTVGQTK